MARPDFSLTWGSDNAPFTAIEASDYTAGWVFRTGAPPRRVNFDYYQNLADKRSNWLGEQMLLAVGHEWQSDVTYDAYAITRSPVDGRLYRSLVVSNIGNEPSVSASQWILQDEAEGSGIVVFTSAAVTNWPVPLAMQLGIIKPNVTVVCGGGAGSRVNATAGGGGGAGGAAIGVVDLTGVTSVTITVGASGDPQSDGLAGGAGGTSSFGAFMSATGGFGGSVGGQGGSGGIGAGGAINTRGNGGGAAAQGTTGSQFMSGFGGGSILCGGTPAKMQGTALAGLQGLHGSGGSGNVLNAAAGRGGEGVVMIEW